MATQETEEYIDGATVFPMETEQDQKDDNKNDEIQDDLKVETTKSNCWNCCHPLFGDWEGHCDECQSPLDHPLSPHDEQTTSYQEIHQIDRCQQCQLFAEKLEISVDDELQFTEDHVGHLILSIIFSPITWLWIPLLGQSPTYILSTIITTILMFVLGVLFRGRLKKLKSPFGLADGGYLFMTFIAQFILNLSILIEMCRIYFASEKNIVYQCYDAHFEEGTTSPPNQCMIYLDLLGNAYVVFFSSIYINVACIRTIKPEKLKTYEKLNEYDKEMNGILDKYKKRKEAAEDDKKQEIDDIITDIKKLFTDIKILLVQEVNNAGFGMYWFRVHCKGIRKEIITKWAAFFSQLVLFLLVWTFGVIFALSSCYIYSDQFYNKISNQPVQLLTIIPASIICMCAVQMLCSTLYKISWIYYKAYSAMKRCEKFLADNDEDLDISLIKIESWFDVRSYVLDNILPLFYEITNPIISLLIVSVIGFTFAFIYQLLVIFEGDPAPFFQSILADNIKFIAFGFTVLLIIACLLIFKWILKPFGEQQAHLDLIQIRKTWLLFDQQQAKIDMLCTYDNDNKKIKVKLQQLDGNIQICDHLIGRMKEFSGAPTVLGFELNEAKLLAIRGYIISVIAIFVGTVWSDYVTTYDDLFS